MSATLLLFGLGLGACAHPAVKSSSAQLRPGMTEDEIFDAISQSPVTFLRQVYETHQVVVLAFMQHENQRQFRALNALLDQVGRDPRLKYIVLERYVQSAPVLEAASVANMNEAQLQQTLLESSGQSSGPTSPHVMLCASNEWAFTWAKVMPRIRALNDARPADDKLLVTSVDGIMQTQFHARFENYERDSLTASWFAKKIWRDLQRDSTTKAIVVYNIGHVMQGFTVQRAGQTVPVNFFSHFLHDHPEARPRAAIVLIEGDGDGQAPDKLGYQFKFTQRQRQRAPDRAFGVPTAPFRGVEIERGDSVLTVKAKHPCKAGACLLQAGEKPSPFGGAYSAIPPEVVNPSTVTLADMVDGIVWLPLSEQPNLTKADAGLQACRHTP